MSRAIVFDLDDTLYAERRFLLSAFASVAGETERLFHVPAAEAFGVLRRTLVRGHRPIALQVLCARFGLPMQMVGAFTALIRDHEPRLRLPRASAAVLHELARGWKVGILTNGLPERQARKIAALGLADKVDAIVYACAGGPGKPESAPFETVLNQLGARAFESVFVGNDPWCDISGARRTGLKTIRVRRGAYARARIARGREADAVVGSLALVPAVAAALVEEAQRHAA